MDKKKWIKNIPLFILEILVLIVAAVILYFTLHATDKEKGVEKVELKEENIAVNEEVKEKQARIRASIQACSILLFSEWMPEMEALEKATEATQS